MFYFFRLDYDQKIYTLTLAITYPELLFPTEYAAEGSITVLPTNVVTPVEVTLGELFVKTFEVNFLTSIFRESDLNLHF